MKLDYKQLFAVFIILTFIAPLIGLFLQPGTITGDVAYADAVGGFKDTNRTAVFENGSLIVWLFGTTTCPHCTWEKPVLEDVVDNFSNVTLKVYYLDNQADIAKMSSFEAQIFQEYSDGSVPLIVIGNKYFRIGSGENSGAEQEKQYVSELIRSLLPVHGQTV